MTLDDKSILITGGTGSFGQKAVETILARYSPSRLIVFSRDEYKQHQMQQVFNADCMRYFIGDVRDRDRLYRAFNGVDIILHAAALKHVPLCEYNPFEAVKTNVLGAQNIVDAAIDNGVSLVMALGSDKGVSPVNIYGASKLVAEKLFVQGNFYSGGRTKFSCTRYGNVIGSRGSVIPLFKEMRETGGTVTITDERMTRFWLTLEQAVDFVLKCLGMMQGGEVFVLKVPSMNVLSLAQAIAPDCEIDYVGIRPGEKLHEVLISRDEACSVAVLKDMYIIEPMQHSSWRIAPPRIGTPVPEGFEYASDTNDWWLTEAQLRRMVR